MGFLLNFTVKNTVNSAKKWMPGLHGIEASWIKEKILGGKSITLINSSYNFITSAIVGGILPIAVGVAQSLKNKNSDNK